MLDFFETVALLVKRGYLRDSEVWETFGNEIFPLYAVAETKLKKREKLTPLNTQILSRW